MEVLTLNGQKYVKASKAARDLGYATDYVGQLCRKGSVDAHLVGRTWYVNPETLGAHRVDKKRNARVKAREHARKSIEEARKLKVQDGTNTYRNIGIRYEGDSKELLPEVRKVVVEGHKVKVPQYEEDLVGDTYELLNKDKKIIMSGTLTVEDVEAEDEYTDTTLLSPRIIKTAQRKVAVREPEEQNLIQVDVESSDDELESVPTTSFTDRLAALDADLSDTGASRVAVAVEQETVTRGLGTVSEITVPRTNELSAFSYIAFGLTLTLALLAVVSTLSASKWVYANGDVSATIISDSSTTIKFINEYIDISAKLYR